MAGATAQTKTIRVAVDSTQAVASVNNLNAAFAHLSNSNPGLAQLIQNLQGVQNAANGAAGSGSGGGGAAAATNRFGALGQSAQAAMQRLSGMTGAMGGIATAGAALGLTAAVGGLVALGTAAVKASAQFEAYKASLATVLGSTEKAGQAFDKLTQFAAQTPFSLDQSVQGFIKLKALGLQPSEKAMISYGNTASAMGKDLNQMVEAVADAATGEYERLKEFGIKASKSGNETAFTFQGVTTKVKNNATDIQNYLMKIGEVNFAGAMERQMQTFNGAMSNLEDTWTQTMAAIGDGGLSKSVAGIVNMITTGLTTITPVLVGLGNAMSGIITGIGSILSGVGTMFSAISTGGGQTGGIMEALTFQFNMIGQVAQVAGAIIGGVFSAIGGLVSGVADMLRTAFGTALAWVGVSFESSGRSWGNSLFGVLRAAKAVAMQLPAIFKIAVNDVMGMFRTLGQAIGALLSGNWAQAKALASKPLFTNTSKALGAVGRIGMATYRDEKGADAAMDRMFGRTKKSTGGPSLADLAGAAPKIDPAAGKDKDDAAKKAAEKAKREKEFWETLKNELATAQAFGIEAQKLTKEKELQKILERDLSTAEKLRVDTMVQDIANAKSLTALKQGSFELENRMYANAQRRLGLSEDEAAIEDAIASKVQAALDSGTARSFIEGEIYQKELATYRVTLQRNQALDKQRELLKDALATARGFGDAFSAGFDIKRLEDQKDAFLKAFSAGDLKDAWGKPLTQATADAISAGFDQGIAAAKNKPIMDALNAASGSSVTAAAALARMNAGQDRDKAMNGLKAAGLSPEEYSRASREIAADYQSKMLKANNMVSDDFLGKFQNGIAQLADMFGGGLGKLLNKFNDAIDNMKANRDGSSGMAQMASLLGNKFSAGFAESAASMMDIGKGIKNLKTPLTDLKNGFDPNMGGSFLKGMGKAVGGAMQGYEIGSTVGDLGKMFGAGKNFQTGAKIGGTIGGLTGNPIIAAGASVIGGLIGSIFGKKAKYSTAQVLSGDTMNLTSRGKSDAASGAGGSVQKGLADIASQLGGAVGAFKVSIGQYDGNWRVSTVGQTGEMSFGKKNKQKAYLHDFGKDGMDAAIAFAIQDAIKDGGITGVAGYIQNALQQAGSDAAIALYKGVKDVTDSLDAMLDPIGASAREIINPVNALIDQMRSYGATAEDISKLEQYKTLKLKAALKDQLASINDFMKALKNDDSVSDYDKLKNALVDFDKMKAQIAAGDSTLSQSDFTALGQEIMSLSQAVYGTSTAQYQDIRSMLLKSSTGFADMITSKFNSAAGYDVNASTVSAVDATTSAINAQTNAIIAQQTVMTDYLRQIAENSANDNGYSNTYSPYLRNKLESVNGQYIGNYY